MGALGSSPQRLVVSIDMMWIRLEMARRARPWTRGNKRNIKATEFLLTPKIGLAVINEENSRWMLWRDSGYCTSERT